MSNSGPAPLRLRLDGAALVANWRALNALSGPDAECGAAVKANGYGLGMAEIVPRLERAGCRNFYVATWQEASEAQRHIKDAEVTVLNGVQAEDMPLATSLAAKPMLNSIAQIERWRSTNLPCDIMINSGMNRLGVDIRELSDVDWSGLNIDVLASHLASADENSGQNADQLAAFKSILNVVPHKRASLANSAGIALGPDYAFDLTRPGLALYGGIPRSELEGKIASVGSIDCRILQKRLIDSGDKVGYNAIFVADKPMTIAIAAIGYADGYLRGFSGTGCFYSQGRKLPVVGRVSMDLVIIDLENAPELGEGDWVNLPLDLPQLSAQSGLSQYEIITGLGQRSDRIWAD